MTRALLVLVAASVGACVPARPPASPFPSAADALARLGATYACARGVHGEAKIDHFSSAGRVRGTVLYYAVRPARLRFDVLAPPPFQSVVSTLTSDGEHFALLDLREKRLYEGAASACNLARLTDVPVPGHALVSLLSGSAPLLVHDPRAARLAWSGRGYYELTLPSRNEAVEVLHLAPTPADFDRPWATQRLRVLDVRVVQQGIDLWHAELSGHAPAVTAAPLVDADGLDEPIAPSGPACEVEVPRTVHVEVPGGDEDIIVRVGDVKLNPPLPPGTFVAPDAGGASRVPVSCD